MGRAPQPAAGAGPGTAGTVEGAVLRAVSAPRRSPETRL